MESKQLKNVNRVNVSKRPPFKFAILGVIFIIIALLIFFLLPPAKLGQFAYPVMLVMVGLFLIGLVFVWAVTALFEIVKINDKNITYRNIYWKIKKIEKVNIHSISVVDFVGVENTNIGHGTYFLQRTPPLREQRRYVISSKRYSKWIIIIEKDSLSNDEKFIECYDAKPRTMGAIRVPYKQKLYDCLINMGYGPIIQKEANIDFKEFFPAKDQSMKGFYGAGK